MRLEQSAKGSYSFIVHTEKPMHTYRTTPTWFACDSFLVRSWFGRGALMVSLIRGTVVAYYGCVDIDSWC